MTNEQEHILKEFIKQLFRAALPPVEADAAISIFEATLVSKEANKEAYLCSILKSFQNPAISNIINKL